jgi:hypothetical protein
MEPALNSFNGEPQAAAFSLHSHQPVSRGTVAFPGAPGLNNLAGSNRADRLILQFRHFDRCVPKSFRGRVDV